MHANIFSVTSCLLIKQCFWAEYAALINEWNKFFLCLLAVAESDTVPVTGSIPQIPALSESANDSESPTCESAAAVATSANCTEEGTIRTMSGIRP